MISCISFLFYIKPQLPQACNVGGNGCISFLFYIKPQLSLRQVPKGHVVFHFFSTSNHNHPSVQSCRPTVVFHFFSTSNHNCFQLILLKQELYFISFLHQTTTRYAACYYVRLLYFISFLHQTTTETYKRIFYSCCISFLFYIKPQQELGWPRRSRVVFHFFSTSNHNCTPACQQIPWLYFISFLHQTTTIHFIKISLFSCISFLFYIKPQLIVVQDHSTCVVFHFFSTSNHNYTDEKFKYYAVVFHFFSTSNHNVIFH